MDKIYHRRNKIMKTKVNKDDEKEIIINEPQILRGIDIKTSFKIKEKISGKWEH